MKSNVIALISVSLMIGMSLFSIIGLTDAESDVQMVDLTPTRAPSQKTDDYPVHTEWDDENYNEPWNQRWHNMSNYLPQYEQREFWLQCRNVSDEYQWLDDVVKTNKGEEVGLGKEDLNETRKRGNPMNFSYPPSKGQELTAKYDTEMNDMGVCNLTINALGQIPQFDFQNPNVGKFKEVNVEVWVDTNGDYDFEAGSGSIEGIMKFDFDWWNTPYDPQDPDSTIEPHVTNASGMWLRGQQQEEYADGLGYWLDLDSDGNPNIPGDIEGGRIWTIVYRTDNQPDDVDGFHPINGEPWLAWWTWDLIIYCGYEEKVSWLSIPYIHPKQVPEADAGEDMGFPENREEWQLPKTHPDHEEAEFNEEYPQIKEGEVITLDGTGSFDPQDDVGQDGIAYGDPDWIEADYGEGNGNIENGFPEGEEDIGEEDTLYYRWSGETSFGGMNYRITISSKWQDSPIFEWRVSLPSMDPQLPASEQYQIVNITLTVLDTDKNQGTDVMQLLAYKSQNPPLVSLDISPQIPNWMNFNSNKYKLSYDEAWVLPNQEIQFNGFASDPDPNSVLKYYWDFIGPFSSFTKQGNLQVQETFTEPGDWTVTLTVYDGPIDNLNTMKSNATVTIHVVDNTKPVPIIRATDPRTPQWHYGSINATKDMIVTFNGSDSYDPDVFVEPINPDDNGSYVGLPGFDEDDDYVPEIDLKYQWDFGDNSRTEGWSNSPETEHSWSEKGARSWGYKFWPVTLSIWDGADTVDSIPYKVFVNVPPTAEAGPNLPTSSGDIIEVGDVVWFDGSGSYDANDDPDFDKVRDEKYDDTLKYIWDFGDGSPQEEGRRINHTYSSPPDNVDRGYEVTLTVDDGFFVDKDKMYVKVLPQNQPPMGVAKIIPESQIAENRVYTQVNIVFDGSESIDPDGEAYTDDLDSTPPMEDFVTFAWNLGDGTITDSPKIEHSYDDNGIYNVTLNMTDKKGGKWEKTIQIEVVNRPPIPVAAKDKITMFIDEQPVMLSAEGSSDPDGEVIGYFWKFGDGETSDKEQGIDGYAPGMVVPHEYDSTGSYTARLYVMDDDYTKSESSLKEDERYDEVTIIIKATETEEQPIGNEVIIGGVVAMTLLLVLLSAAGVTYGRKRV